MVATHIRVTSVLQLVGPAPVVGTVLVVKAVPSPLHLVTLLVVHIPGLPVVTVVSPLVIAT